MEIQNWKSMENDQILFFTADNSSADFFFILFHE